MSYHRENQDSGGSQSRSGHESFPHRRKTTQGGL